MAEEFVQEGLSRWVGRLDGSPFLYVVFDRRVTSRQCGGSSPLGLMFFFFLHSRHHCFASSAEGFDHLCADTARAWCFASLELVGGVVEFLPREVRHSALWLVAAVLVVVRRRRRCVKLLVEFCEHIRTALSVILVGAILILLV